MAFDVDRLLRLWTDPLPDDDADAAAAFRALYTDPVRVNGADLTAADLVARARALQGVFEAPEREVLDVVEGDGKVALAFRMGGRQIGTLTTAAGPLAPTGQRLGLRVIDVLTLTDGRGSAVWRGARGLGGAAP